MACRPKRRNDPDDLTRLNGHALRDVYSRLGSLHVAEQAQIARLRLIAGVCREIDQANPARRADLADRLAAVARALVHGEHGMPIISEQLSHLVDVRDENLPDVTFEQLASDVAIRCVGQNTALRTVSGENKLSFDGHSRYEDQWLESTPVSGYCEEERSALLLARDWVEGSCDVAWHDHGLVLGVDEALEPALVEIENQGAGNPVDCLGELAQIGLDVLSSRLESPVLHGLTASCLELSGAVHPLPQGIWQDGDLEILPDEVLEIADSGGIMGIATGLDEGFHIGTLLG